MEEQTEQLTKRERRLIKKQARLEDSKKQNRNKKITSIVIWSAVLLLIVGIVYSIIKFGDIKDNNNNAVPTTLDAVTEADQVRGNPDSKIVLIEYSDFQCPACASYSPLLKQLAKDYNNKILFAYRHFPLKEIHQNAELAAWAAEAAGKQNAFWEMHDLLFDNQKGWSNENDPKNIFISYAKELNLNIETFESDLDSDEVKDKVNNDYQSGLNADVPGTPTLFLNGVKLRLPENYEELKEIIEESL